MSAFVGAVQYGGAARGLEKFMTGRHVHMMTRRD
jgi:hypothetical protein